MSKCLVCFDPVVKIGWMALLTLDDACICCRCEIELEKISGALCNECGRMMKGTGSCGDCLRWRQHPFWSDKSLYNRSVYTYNEGMKGILNQFKFRGDVELAKVFKQNFCSLFQKEFSKVNLICPIPLSDSRLYERGFNQASVLAELLGKEITPLLTKKHKLKQSKKSRKERMDSENPFELLTKISVEGKHIILIDDIYTTGTTIRNAGKILLEQGAAKISALTLIRS